MCFPHNLHNGNSSWLFKLLYFKPWGLLDWNSNLTRLKLIWIVCLTGAPLLDLICELACCHAEGGPRCATINIVSNGCPTISRAWQGPQPSSTPASTFVTRYSLVIEPRTSESICMNGACRWLLPRNSTAELFRKQWPTVSTELPYQMKVSVALWQDTYSCSEDMFRSLYPFPVSITSRKCIRWCLGLWLANWRRPRLEIVQYMATNYVPWEASIPLDSCANMV